MFGLPPELWEAPLSISEVGAAAAGEAGEGRTPSWRPEPRLMVTLFLVCCSRRCFCLADLGPGVSHASGRNGGHLYFGCFGFSGAKACPCGAVSDHTCLPTLTLLTVVTELSEVMVQTAFALMKECLHCVNGCVPSLPVRQWPRFSRSAAARAVGRPLYEGGSLVWIEVQAVRASA